MATLIASWSRGQIQKIHKEGTESLPLSPLPRIKTSLFRTCSLQHCERIRDAKQSNINVSEDRIKTKKKKRFLKQNRSVSGRKKRGEGCRSPPPLNPPMGRIDWQKSVFLQTNATHFEKLMTTVDEVNSRKNLFFAVFCFIVLLPNSMSKLIHNQCKLTCKLLIKTF